MFPNDFRNKIWSRQYGEVQTLLRNSNDNVDEFIFNISNCTWIDPLPFLSLLISLNEIKNTSKSIYIKLQDAKFLSEGNKRVLCFLKNEGFLEEAAKCNIEFLNTKNKKISKLELYNIIDPFNEFLYFQESTILPAEIVDLGIMADYDDIVKFIEKKLRTCEHKLKNKISSYSYKKTFSSLRLFLIEAVTNIYEHAYPNSEFKYAGIFIRYRTGMTDSSIATQEKLKLRKALTEEKINSYRLSTEFPESVTGFLEVFVIDAGIGLSKSYLGNRFIEHDDPFHLAWEESIGQGRRNPVKEKTTKFGGLFVIGNIVENSYLCARDENEWIGEELPLIRESGTNEKILNTNTQVTGLSLILRLSWKKTSIDQKGWTSPSILYRTFDNIKSIIKHHPLLKGITGRSDIYLKYFNSKFSNFKGGNPVFIKEERFGSDKDEIQKYIKKILPINYLENGTSENYILYLPQPNQSKSKISEKVITGFDLVDNPSKSIIIADIPDYDAALYQYALEDAKYDSVFSSQFDKIILVTQNLSVLILVKMQLQESKNYTYIVDDGAAHEYIHSSENYETFSPDRCLEHLVEWLKTHDSMIYWLNIYNKPNRGDFFVNGNIVWYKNDQEFILKNYFGFSHTLSDEISIELYGIMLNRCISLRTDDGFIFIAIDNLTSKIANTVNTKFSEKFSTDGIKIFIGSVYVTGVLEENSLYYSVDKTSLHHLIHFLYNSTVNIKPEGRATMLLWPSKEFLNLFDTQAKKNYRRVGHTSTIAPFGWKYYSIPRFSHKEPELINTPISELLESELHETKIEGNTICSPYETYRDWQNTNMVSIGHYEYSTYHDLFKIDTLYAFDESWQLKGNLSIYFIAEIMHALGVTLDQLRTKNNILKAKLTKYADENNIVFSKSEKCPIAVYPAHYALEIIIQKIKYLLPPDAASKIVSLVSISPNRTSITFLPSPQSMDLIRKEVSAYKEAKNTSQCSLLFLDTVRINGNTEKQIKHILTLLGATEIISLILLDRQLIPIHRAKKDNDKIYWKLDIPVFGNKNSCPLCKGLERIDLLKKVLVVDLFVDRINEYPKIWGKTDRYANITENYGIKPQNVTLKHREKKLGIFVDDKGFSQQLGGDKNKICLTNSTGLMIYSAELHSMTSRDNMALEIVKNEDLSEETKIELITSNLLLFNYQFSRFTLYELLRILIKTAKNITTPNNYTALTLLTLVAYDKISEELINSSIKEAEENFLDVKNIDILIYLCYFSNYHENNSIKEYSEIRRYLKGYKDLLDLNKQFHQELYNDYGKDHDTPLYLTAVQLKFTKLFFEQSYSSICKLRYLLKEYDISDFNRIKTFQELSDVTDEIDEKIKELKSQIVKYKNYDELRFDNEIEEIRKVTHPIFSFLRNKFLEIHENLFISLSLDKDEFNLRQELIDLISNINSDNSEVKKTIGISTAFRKPATTGYSNIKERWVIWDKAVVTEIIYLLRNCKHIDPEDLFPDPFDTKSGEKRHMWIYTTYTDTHLFLRFVNLTTANAAEVEQNSANKFRYEKVRINKLGGSFKYANTDLPSNTGEDKALIVSISLPFI